MQASLSFFITLLLKGVLASAREPEKGYASKPLKSNDASILVFFYYPFAHYCKQ